LIWIIFVGFLGTANCEKMIKSLKLASLRRDIYDGQKVSVQKCSRYRKGR